MATEASSILIRRLLFSLALLLISTRLSDAEERKKFIVYIGDKPHGSIDAIGTHLGILSKVLGSHEAAKESIFHSYTVSMNAFAAMLTEDEAAKLSESDDVISVIPSRTRKIHTTRSWDFIGFPPAAVARRRGVVPSNLIIGVLDSGIDPHHPSFRDKGYGPPPARWKGSCGPFANFSCNNKIIGAKWFRLDGKVPAGDVASPLDKGEHGTHVASTIAGGFKPRASVAGLGRGTARGGVPSVRIAVYKVCYMGGECNDEDVLAAFEAAIADGVDIINLSVGDVPGKRFTDTMTIGAYHAMRKGILTSTTAGNEGPMNGTVGHYSPWFLTVGASSIDRQFRTDLKLGNGKTIQGISLNTFKTRNTLYPIIYGFQAALEGQMLNAIGCAPDSLDPKLVNGSIVICFASEVGPSDSIVQAAGGIGVVIQLDTLVDQAFSFVIPAIVVSAANDGQTIKDYVISGKAVGRIERSYQVNITAPIVPPFSARGPSLLYTEILKPDLVAPGLNILAAIPSHGHPHDPKYGVKSGTSMAAPHATAAAAYVKTFHRKWSPAAIRSALMTTAKVMDRSSAEDGEYAFGAGQIDPVRALEPGLVYDANEASYLRFMCTKYPNITAINILTGCKAFDCGPHAVARGYDGLNYPSFHYVVSEPARPSKAVFNRIVKNVGPGPAVYRASVTAPAGVEVVVDPPTLSFSRAKERKSFRLTVRVAAVTGRKPYLVSGSLWWNDGVHSVRSPIAIHYT